MGAKYFVMLLVGKKLIKRFFKNIEGKEEHCDTLTFILRRVLLPTRDQPESPDWRG